MITGKRGQEQLLSVITQLIIVTLFLILVVYVINSTMSGKLVKDQMAAKEIALVLDSAKAGTTISVASDAILTIEGNRVRFQSVGNKAVYEYEFYSPYHISMETREGLYIITVN